MREPGGPLSGSGSDAAGPERRDNRHDRRSGNRRGPRPNGTHLRDLLADPAPRFIMEAHDGLSARIVEAEGFDGIWASGLSISTALGVRDSNEVSWTQVFDVVERMAEATSIPILVDGDTGFGNFNNARRAVARLCAMGVDGICLEDKIFPKINSFVGSRHPLADVEEFTGKIRACKDTQPDEDFCVVARCEALVAGHGLAEALRRAEAYHAAGCDALFIQSRSVDGEEVLAFGREWAARCPVVVTPTSYHSVPAETLGQAGISLIIWANHTMRASLLAMREVCREVRRTGTTSKVERELPSLREVFDLLDYDELEQASQRYLPQHPAEDEG